MNFDYDKYKNNLKDYLQKQGHKTDSNPMKCINPDHSDNNPSMLIYLDYFRCNSCDCFGDIYDAVGLIEGITEKKDQFIIIDNIYGSGEYKNNTDNYKKSAENKFITDKKSEDILREYFKKSALENLDKIKEYLKKRDCSEDMVKDISKILGYWPGFDSALNDIGKETLKLSGIPLIHPLKKISSWGSPGVTVRIGKGFKLFFYENNDSKKIGSKSCETFPFPGLPDNVNINIVEGEMSAISMIWAGFDNTIAIGGINALSDNNLEKLLSYDNIYILFDSDKPGREKREQLKKRLLLAGYTGNIYIVRLPSGQDPDDMIKQGKTNEIENLIKESEKKEEILKVYNEINNYDDKKEFNKISDSKINNPEIKKEKLPFYFAGYDENAYYVVPINQSIPLRISRHDSGIKGMLYDLASFSWWCGKFPKEKENGEVTVNIPGALAWFRKTGQSRGLYDVNAELGVGAHFDNGDILVNTGNGLYSQNNKLKFDYSEYEGKNFYIRSKNFFDISGESWTIKDTHALFRELNNYGFQRDIDYMFLAGFIVLAPFASLLHRRPHLAIMGPKGTGKTTLISNIIRPAIGELGIYIEGRNSSEAGIRQAIGRDCRPTILDEFEAHNTEEAIKNKNILSLARSAYGGEGETIKGTQNQKNPITFKTKMMFLFAAININFDNDADRTRISIIKMRKSTEIIGKTFEFNGLRKRTFDNIKFILENIKMAKNFIQDKIKLDARTADTYGTLMGGFWSLISDCKFLESKNQKINEITIKAMKHIEIDFDDLQDDEELLFDCILNYKIRIDPVTEKTIAEMLYEENATRDGVLYDTKLKQIGIKRDMKMKIDNEVVDIVAISVNNGYISDILKNTPFQKYKNILIRHQAVLFEETRSIRMLSGKRERCIIMKWDEIRKLHYECDENNLPF